MYFSRIVLNELLEALDQGKVIPSVVERNPHFDGDAAYKVAGEIVRLRRARGEKTIGRKIGFTNRGIWAEYGATAPIWAHVYDRTVQFAAGHRATVSLKGSVQPRIEPEIAFKLKAPLRAGVNHPALVLEAIEWLAPSFEIVDCHFADWKFGPADSVADFSFHWRLVVGEPRAVHGDEISGLVEQLRDCNVTLSRNGQFADRGVGANALGHPAAALAFLADILMRQPQFEPLAAGEVITTGTLTAAMPIHSGETWSSRYEGLPGVTGLTLRFTD
ncbi:MAG TPA: fumarylacetoacetate hydrolase family protein [Burkholderiales bacterium]|nr:fumarylacetoacetate hydrolase family protein [Burkholderiales bacterium]